MSSVQGTASASLPAVGRHRDVRFGSGAGRAALALGAIVAVLFGVAAPPGMDRAGAQTTASIFEATLAEPNQKTVEVSTAELRQMLTDGSATVFDARPHLEWSISHIPGALNVAPKPDVPMSVYVADVKEIERVQPDKAAAIVLYCNGPFCGKSKRLAEELLEAGYTNVRRYQLGAPTWRALVGVMEIELDGLRYVMDGDRTAVWYDGRPAPEFAAGSLPGARHLPKAEVTAAKDDGRLPMEDHNTRIIVFGANGAQAREVAQEIAKNAFHNVSYYNGTFETLKAALAP